MNHLRKVIATAKRLDDVAQYLEQNFRDHGYTQRQAQAFCYHLDSMADQLMEANGLDPQAFYNEATVMERDMDEPYMDTFNGPGVIERDDDETYLDHMDDMSDSEMHDPLEGDLPTEASFDYWGETTEASGDYWNDAPKKDYWNDTHEAGQADYWDDNLDF